MKAGGNEQRERAGNPPLIAGNPIFVTARPTIYGICFGPALRSAGAGGVAKGRSMNYAVSAKFTREEDKNNLLKRSRNISFWQIVFAIGDGRIADVIEHPNRKKYGGQIFIMAEYDNYIYVVPASISDTGEECRLRTIYPSRKYAKKFPGGRE